MIKWTTKFAENLVSTVMILTVYTVERNKALDEFALSQDATGVIHVRIQQLALCKLLVNIHKKDLFILVTAYAKLGEAYLKNRYFE